MVRLVAISPIPYIAFLWSFNSYMVRLVEKKMVPYLSTWYGFNSYMVRLVVRIACHLLGMNYMFQFLHVAIGGMQCDAV